MHILWKIGLGFFIVIVVVFGLAFWSTDRCSGCYTHIYFAYNDLSNFNQTQIIESIRENLTNEPAVQNRNFGYLEDIKFSIGGVMGVNGSIVFMKFPILLANDSEELLVIVKTLNEIESISQVSEPIVRRLSAP